MEIDHPLRLSCQRPQLSPEGIYLKNPAGTSATPSRSPQTCFAEAMQT